MRVTTSLTLGLVLLSGSTIGVLADSAPFIDGQCLFDSASSESTSLGPFAIELTYGGSAVATRQSSSGAAILTNLLNNEEPLPVFDPPLACYSNDGSVITQFIPGVYTFPLYTGQANDGNFNLSEDAVFPAKVSGSVSSSSASLMTSTGWSQVRTRRYGNVGRDCIGLRRWRHASSGASAVLNANFNVTQTASAPGEVRVVVTVPKLQTNAAYESYHGIWPTNPLTEQPFCISKCATPHHPVYAGVSQSACIFLTIKDASTGDTLDEQRISVLQYSWATGVNMPPQLSWSSSSGIGPSGSPLIGTTNTTRASDCVNNYSHITQTASPAGNQLVFTVPLPEVEGVTVTAKLVQQTAPDANKVPWLNPLSTDPDAWSPPYIRNFHWQGLARDLSLISLTDQGCVTAFGIPLPPGPSPLDCLADVAGPGQVAIPDGELTADDIIVFVGWYFANDPRADIASSGQIAGADGLFTADDLILFINRFFAGCSN
jgi:hypothetical protein